MAAKEEVNNLSQKREQIIQRILNLSEEQFDRLITLYLQQETETHPACQAVHLTYT